MTGTATARLRLDAAQAWALVELHRIALTPVHDGKWWMASADLLGRGHNSKRAIDSLSAMAGDCLGAVSALVDKLDGLEP